MSGAARGPGEIFVDAGGGEQGDGHVAEARQQPTEGVDERAVGPVQVADPNEHRPTARRRRDHRRDGPYDLFASALRIDAVERRRATEEVHERVDEPLGRHGDRGPETAYSVGNELGLHRFVGTEIEQRAHDECERRERRRLTVRQATAGGSEHAVPLPGDLEQLVGQPALADAALALDGDGHRSLPGEREVERGEQRGQFGLAPDKREVPTGVARSRPAEWLEREPRLDRLDAPAHGHQSRGLISDCRLGCRVGGRPDEHRARRRLRLQPGGQVHDVAHRRVVATGNERADEHLAGVHPDSKTNRLGELVGQLGDGGLHRQPGPHAALGVVLVGSGCTEQGEHAVAEDLVHPAAVGVHVGHQALHATVDQPAHLLGVAMLGQRGEPHDVGEQHGHHATLVTPAESGRRQRRTARGTERCPRGGGSGAARTVHVDVRRPVGPGGFVTGAGGTHRRPR